MPLRISKSGSTIATFKILNFDSDAQTFLTAAGITNSTQQNAINKLTIDLKYYGLWTKMKALYPVVGGTSAAHAVNLRTPGTYNLSFTAGWVHSSTGMTPNGTSDYAATGLNATILNSSSNHVSFYSITNSQAAAGVGKIDIGCQTGANNSYFLGISDYASFVACAYVNAGNAIIVTQPSDTRGFALMTVQSLTSFKGFLYSPGTSFAQRGSTITTVSGALPNNQIYLCRNGSEASNYEYSNRGCAFASIGDGLTDQDAINFYNIVQRYQINLGRQV